MKHGGDISIAQSVLKTAYSGHWLDLSTGIAPQSYPVPSIAPGAWQRLPQSASVNALSEAARCAYQVPDSTGIVAAPGTQILIQLMPLFHPHVKRVRILGPTYCEHALCWQRFVADTATVTSLDALAGADVTVITNPNNPDGRTIAAADLALLAEQHTQESRLLILDEAFADVVPDASTVPYAGCRGLIILRSFGKFYGLAGLRLGFAIGDGAMMRDLATALGPWAVSGPACDIAAKALRDDAWAAAARVEYRRQAAQLDLLLERYGLEIIGGTALFRLVCSTKAATIHAVLAREGVLTRIFEDHPTWLRFGLPGSAVNFDRLEAALALAQQAPPAHQTML